MNASSQCFVCGAPTAGTPPGFHSSAACETCQRRARLLPSGVPLTELLAPTERGQLDSDGLSTLLNPVAIDVYRGWAGFAEGTFIVFEERERSTDWLDFIVQHITPGPEVLQILRDESPPPTDARAALQMLAKRFPKPLNQFARVWVSCRASKAVLEHSGPLQTNEDVVRALAAIAEQPSAFDEADARGLMARLYSLADVVLDD